MNHFQEFKPAHVFLHFDVKMVLEQKSLWRHVLVIENFTMQLKPKFNNCAFVSVLLFFWIYWLVHIIGESCWFEQWLDSNECKNQTHLIKKNLEIKNLQVFGKLIFNYSIIFLLDFENTNSKFAFLLEFAKKYGVM